MTASDVQALSLRFQEADVDLWLDGGWAVDALLGEQTREHDDLDIVVQTRHESRLRRTLEAAGFRDRPRADTRPWNYVLVDAQGREIDVHVVRDVTLLCARFGIPLPNEYRPFRRKE